MSGPEGERPGAEAALRERQSLRMLRAADAVMDRVLAALEQTEPGDLAALGAVTKLLKELQGLNRSPLDVAEQEAKIAKLRCEARVAEAPESGPLRIEFINTDGAEE